MLSLPPRRRAAISRRARPPAAACCCRKAPESPRRVNGVPLYWVCRPFAALGVDALYALMRLRQEGFAVEQQCAYLYADVADRACWHLLGWSSGQQLQASLRIVPPGLKYGDASIGRVGTTREMRGSGLGQELLAKGLLRCRQLHPGADIRISAQAHLRRFYAGF